MLGDIVRGLDFALFLKIRLDSKKDDIAKEFEEHYHGKPRQLSDNVKSLSCRA